MKKLMIVLAVLVSAFSVFAANVTNINLEAEIQIKQSVPNASMFGWRDVLYVDMEIEEGSNADYKIRSNEVRKGYSNFELLQIGNKSTIKIDPKGKETTFKPGKFFTVDGGIIWLSFSAPDKNTYKLPTSVKIVPKKPVETVAVVEEELKPEVVEYKSKMPELMSPSFDEMFFLKGEDSYPDNGQEECAYVDVSKQLPEKNVSTNEQVVVKNLPAGTKSKIFVHNTKEILVYLAPDLTLKQGANSYTLFYATRRLGKDEPFSAPKRVMENPKVNGKVCNIPEFTGEVFSGNGKKRLVLVWTQLTKQIDEEITAEELCRTTAIYTCALEDDANLIWEKPEVVSEVSGTLQFHPELYNSGKVLALSVTNRTDNDYITREVNPAFPVNYNYFVYDKSNKWKGTNGAEFVKIKDAFAFTDKNSVIPELYEYVYNKDQVVNGVVYSATYVDEDDGETYTNCFAKTYVKSPETKKMIWTESVPIIYHKKSDKVLYPSATVRPTGEWLVSYLSETETGNNLCVARVNVEPCLVTKTMVPNLDDMEHPGSSVRFMVELRNEGLAICEGCDVIVKNELNTEAGKITSKQILYPGTTYCLPSVYAKLKEDPKVKSGVVPCENIKAEVKPVKAVANSKFAINKAAFTMGIPHFKISDIFVKTKGFAQTLYMVIGTSNGVKVKAPGVEILLTEKFGKNEETENVEVIPIDYDLSDDYFLVDYAYLTGNDPEKSFDVLPHVHFSEKSKHLPRYTKDEIEEMTSCSGEYTVYNPLLTKDCVSGGIIAKSFTKKTKVMEVDFVIMNNWPEVVEDAVELELINIASGKVDQTLTVPFKLEVLKAQQIKCSFGPAFSDVEADYEVRLILPKNDSIAEPVHEESVNAVEEDENELSASSPTPLEEGEEVILEEPASSSETESFDEVEDVTE